MNSYKNKLHMLACDHASDMDNRNFKDFCYDYLDTILSSNPTLFLMEVALPCNVKHLFWEHASMMGKEGSRAWLSVWVALLRVIWQKRNEILFRNEVLSFVDLRNAFVYKAWTWLRANIKPFTYS